MPSDVGAMLMASRAHTIATLGPDAPPPKYTLPVGASARMAPFGENPRRYAQSQEHMASRPAYAIAAAKMPKYHPDGSGAARDSWINAKEAAVKGKHLDTAEQLYWKEKLGAREYRGKCKAANSHSQDGDRMPRPKLPLVPTAAPPPPAETVETALARVGRGVASARTVEQLRHEEALLTNRCDELSARLLGVSPRKPARLHALQM